MNKFKLFLENILVYGLGGVISKIIPLIMVPIVTRLMPNTEYYGISDLSNTMVSLASYFAVLGMYDTMYRMFFETEDDEFKKDVCSTAFLFTIGTSAIVFFIMLICRKIIANIFFGNPNYSYLVYISAITTLTSATNTIISAPTRMQNKKIIFLVTNTISPILSYSISIPLLLSGHYIIALPLASAIAGFTMEISFYIMNHSWFSIRRFRKDLLKKMLIIAVPLFPNFLIYWIFNSSDRVMIANLLDTSAAGVYAVGAKIGACSQLIYTAFAGGWQYFAFSTMNEENQVESNSMVFEYLGIISFAFTSFICACSYWIFKILFTADYLSGYCIAPYLFLAPLLQMLYQVIANQFLVIKKTWPSTLILLSGAIANIVINFALIPLWGIEGAALATLVGYTITDFICSIVLIRMKLLIISKRFIISVIAMISYMWIWRLYLAESIMRGLTVAVVLYVLFIWLYKEEIELLKIKIKKS